MTISTKYKSASISTHIEGGYYSDGSYYATYGGGGLFISSETYIRPELNMKKQNGKSTEMSVWSLLMKI